MNSDYEKGFNAAFDIIADYVEEKYASLRLL